MLLFKTTSTIQQSPFTEGGCLSHAGAPPHTHPRSQPRRGCPPLSKAGPRLRDSEPPGCAHIRLTAEPGSPRQPHCLSCLHPHPASAY